MTDKIEDRRQALTDADIDRIADAVAKEDGCGIWTRRLPLFEQ